MTNAERFEEIQGNWEYERCVKPEDIPWLIQRVEDLEHENVELKKHIKEHDPYGL